MQRTAIFLDRDGVLNQSIVKNGKPYPPSTLSELIIPDDVIPALKLLKVLGYLLIVVTNQPDVARGSTTRSMVESINSALLEKLPLDEILVCYHDDKDNCTCRKPLPGLLISAAQKHHINLESSFMIGDRWKDIAAGQNAGCKTIWLDNNYEEQKPKLPNFTATSLIEAALWIQHSKISSHINLSQGNQSEDSSRLKSKDIC
ncbi:MAG: HAD family hydrolase [Gammaproteobacteria bacterium]|nr:HAD family hydrolase [Gammaproteobacteria bacterium]